jgi:hypothetical protein
MVEKEFPGAKAFVRPGFDTPRPGIYILKRS